MKLYKATIFFYDANAKDDDYTDEQAKDILECTLERDGYFNHKIFDMKSKPIGEWNDDIDINFTDCPQYKYERYFSEPCCDRPILDDITTMQDTKNGYEVLLCTNCNTKITRKI